MKKLDVTPFELYHVCGALERYIDDVNYLYNDYESGASDCVEALYKRCMGLGKLGLTALEFNHVCNALKEHTQTLIKRRHLHHLVDSKELDCLEALYERWMMPVRLELTPLEYKHLCDALDKYLESGTRHVFRNSSEEDKFRAFFNRCWDLSKKTYPVKFKINLDAVFECEKEEEIRASLLAYLKDCVTFEDVNAFDIQTLQEDA